MVIISLIFLEGIEADDDLSLRHGMRFIDRRRGARVGRHAEIMPAEDSTMTHVQAFESVPENQVRDRGNRVRGGDIHTGKVRGVELEECCEAVNTCKDNTRETSGIYL
jgi:hypothetical protein